VAVRHLVARQELLGGLRLGRPLVPEHGDAGEGRPAAGTPLGQQLVEDGVQPLLRRVPRLEQVPVEVDVVDRPDRGVGVGVGGEQHPLRARRDVHGQLEELHAGHAGHPVVGEQQGGVLPAQGELAQRLEGVRPGLGPHDPVVGAVAPPQVAGDRPAHRGVVVDGQQDGPRAHRPSRLPHVLPVLTVLVLTVLVTVPLRAGAPPVNVSALGRSTGGPQGGTGRRAGSGGGLAPQRPDAGVDHPPGAGDDRPGQAADHDVEDEAHRRHLREADEPHDARDRARGRVPGRCDLDDRVGDRARRDAGRRRDGGVTGLRRAARPSGAGSRWPPVRG
jgi:hypothetical protein